MRVIPADRLKFAFEMLSELFLSSFRIKIDASNAARKLQSVTEFTNIQTELIRHSVQFRAWNPNSRPSECFGAKCALQSSPF